jgi:hypothetical protein
MAHIFTHLTKGIEEGKTNMKSLTTRIKEEKTIG